MADRALSEEAMREDIRRNPRHVWPNVIMAFDNYLLTYACPEGTCPNTMHAVGFGSARNHSRAELLMRWFLYIAQAVTVITLPTFSYQRYMPQKISPYKDQFF